MLDEQIFYGSLKIFFFKASLCVVSIQYHCMFCLSLCPVLRKCVHITACITSLLYIGVNKSGPDVLFLSSFESSIIYKHNAPQLSFTVCLYQHPTNYLLPFVYINTPQLSLTVCLYQHPTIISYCLSISTPHNYLLLFVYINTPQLSLTVGLYQHPTIIYILIRVCDSSSGLHGPLIANPIGCLKTMWASHVTSRVKVCLYNEIRTHQPILFPHRSWLVSPAAILSTAMTYKLTWPLLTWPDL